MAVTEISYQSTGADKAFLKLAMLRHWDARCAWCTNTLQDTSSFELDHVVAQDQFGSARVDRPELALDFDVDAVENLAPLCVARRCNQRKKDSLDGAFLGVVVEVLEHSKKKARAIRASVRRMQGATGLEAAVLQVLSADLGEERVQALLGTYGTNLVGRLYRFDPAIVESATTSWPMWQEARSVMNFPCYDDVTVVVDVDLNASGRAALNVAQKLENVGVRVGKLIAQAADEIGPELDEVAGGFCEPDSLPRVEGRSLDFSIGKRFLRFTMSGVAYRHYLGLNDYGMYDKPFVVGGPYEIFVKIRLDGAWSSSTKVKGEPRVHSVIGWEMTDSEPDDLEEWTEQEVD